MSATEGILERTNPFVKSSEDPDPGAEPEPMKRAITFGQPIINLPNATERANSEEQADFRLQRQGTIEMQEERANLQASELGTGKGGTNAVDEVKIETGRQESRNLHIWDKLKNRKAALSKDHNV
jgi:hypothetical protein